MMPQRTADFPILPVIIERWSPSAFDSSHILSGDELGILFEAARWAPSAFNFQPWRFVYGLRGDDEWREILHGLIPFNQSWACHASALVCVCSETDAPTRQGGRTASYSHSFDAGAAWACLALQASAIGLHTHAMTGFDPERVGLAIHAPENSRIDVVVAVGRRGDAARLPDTLRAREAPNGRKPISAFVFKGRFSAIAG